MKELNVKPVFMTLCYYTTEKLSKTVVTSTASY